VHHVVETYAGARHGFAVPDLPVFDQGAAERHWTALFTLLQETLAGA
jgi:carboxymethylenebutenolidase